MLRKSLSIELESFMGILKISKDQKFTKSAFVQARKKISPKVFKHLSHTLIEEFYTDNEPAVKTWKGFRLLAVDGSRVTLPLTKELKSYFGETKNHTTTTIVQARCSVLYDVENNYAIDGELAPVSQGERAMALSHLIHCKHGDLILYDRGYPSYEFIKYHIVNNLDYVIRVHIGFSKLIGNFEKSRKKSQIISIGPGIYIKQSDKGLDKTRPIKVRLVRVELPNGQVEILMTSLHDNKTYPNGLFKSLYYKRWHVETFYDELKNKLKVEHFSGYSKQSILQDFYAALFISNVQTLIVSELEDEIAEKNKQRRLDYKINKNLSYGFLKNRVVEIFFTESPMEEPLKELKQLFMQNLIPIRPKRSFKRDLAKYRTRSKPKITKNQKDSI